MRPSKTLMRRLGALAIVGALVGAAGGSADASSPEWRSLAPMLTPRTEATAVVHDGEIYVMGGYAPPAVTVPTVEIYDPQQDAWRPGPPLPLPVNHAAGAVVGDSIYVFGGYLGYALGSDFSAVALPTAQSFVLEDGAWSEIAPLPEPRAAGAAAVVGGKVYVVGGVLDDGTLAETTLVYDPATDRWTERRGPSYPRQHLGAAAHAGKVIAVGGRIDLLNSNVGSTDAFHPRTGRWTQLPSLPSYRGGLGVAATRNGLVVAVGGEGATGTFGEAEALHMATRRWFSLPPLPTPRHGVGVVAIGNTVYVIGGGPQPSYSYSGANEAIDLSGVTPPP